MSLLEHKKEPFDKRHLKFLCSRLQPSTKLENYLGEAEKYYESDAERKMYCKRISNKFVNAVCEYLNQYLFIVNDYILEGIIVKMDMKIMKKKFVIKIKMR